MKSQRNLKRKRENERRITIDLKLISGFLKLVTFLIDHFWIKQPKKMKDNSEKFPFLQDSSFSGQVRDREEMTQHKEKSTILSSTQRKIKEENLIQSNKKRLIGIITPNQRNKLGSESENQF